MLFKQCQWGFCLFMLMTIVNNIKCYCGDIAHYCRYQYRRNSTISQPLRYKELIAKSQATQNDIHQTGQRGESWWQKNKKHSRPKNESCDISISLFSALLNPRSNIGDIILNSQDTFTFYGCWFFKEEIKEHREKIIHLSGYDYYYEEVEALVFGQIEFDQK